MGEHVIYHVTRRVQNQSKRRLVARHNSIGRQGRASLYKVSKKKERIELRDLAEPRQTEANKEGTGHQ